MVRITLSRARLNNYCLSQITDIPFAAFPTSVPAQPTLPPNGDITQSDTIRQLTPYGLEYTVTETRAPFRDEFIYLAEVTRVYLLGHFDDYFKDAEFTRLEEFQTIFTGSSFEYDEPILAEYVSTAVFEASSNNVPSVQVLDETLATAFEGENLNGFIGMLQSLPPENIFSTTTFVKKRDAGQKIVSSSLPKRQATVTTTAGAASLALIVAVLSVYKRKRDAEEDKQIRKK